MIYCLETVEMILSSMAMQFELVSCHTITCLQAAASDEG